MLLKSIQKKKAYYLKVSLHNSMLQLPSTELEQEPVLVLGRNAVMAQGGGARSSASAN